MRRRDSGTALRWAEGPPGASVASPEQRNLRAGWERQSVRGALARTEQSGATTPPGPGQTGNSSGPRRDCYGPAAEPFPAMAPSRKSRSSPRDQAPSRLDGGPGPVTFNLRWPGPVSICQGPSGGVRAAGRCEGAPRLSPGLPPPPCHLPGSTGTVPVQGGTAAVKLRNRFQRWRRHESHLQVHEIRRHRALMGGPGPVTFNLVWPGPVSICQGHLRGQTGTVQVKSRRLRSGQGRAAKPTGGVGAPGPGSRQAQFRSGQGCCGPASPWIRRHRRTQCCIGHEEELGKNRTSGRV